jgi:maltooligosyltrehalose synthase
MALVKLSVVPNFIKAPTLERLRLQMYLNNIRLSSWVEYFDIQKDGNSWVAFFYEELPLETAANNLPKPKKV